MRQRRADLDGAAVLSGRPAESTTVLPAPAYLGSGLVTGPVRSTARARSARVVTPIL
jgi:hypothetical protein